MVCIYRSGQEGCPSSYPEPQSTNETADDRKCGGTCQCAQPHCGTLSAYSDTACNNALPADWPVPVGCVAALSEAHSFKFEHKTFCNPAPFTPVISGGVQQQATTVCCRSPIDG